MKRQNLSSSGCENRRVLQEPSSLATAENSVVGLQRSNAAKKHNIGEKCL